MPKPHRRLGYAVAILIAFFVVVLLFLYTSGLMGMPPGSSGEFGFAGGVVKKLWVGQVSFEGVSPNVLSASVTVVAGSDNGVITGALVKESSGTIVAEGDPLPNVLQGYNETPITVSLDSNLPSGTYWLFISVEGGGSFRSPSFTIP